MPDGLNVETEVRVKAFGRQKVRHGKHEMIERMNAERALLGYRRDIAAHRCHRSLPLFNSPCARARPLARDFP